MECCDITAFFRTHDESILTQAFKKCLEVLKVLGDVMTGHQNVVKVDEHPLQSS